MGFISAFIIGLIIGAAIALVINRLQMKDASSIAKELIVKAQDQKTEDIDKLLNQVKDSFKALSSDVLSKSSQDFLALANEALSRQTQTGESNLEGKKKLIDQTLGTMKEDLNKVEKLVREFEKDRENKYGELTNQLKTTAEQTAKLQETTNKLQVALVSTKKRGDWGERMAEDVLRLAGFIEGINYKKQKSQESVNSRPDYTFLLPQGSVVNMDVKFPLNNYLNYLAVDGKIEKESYKEQFLRDVKGRIKEVTTRDYINPEEHTVDFVIVFIPNEQVYEFVNESDRSILDEALKKKVIFCSPLTLYAILAVIRQALDNFRLESTAKEILAILGVFDKQWAMFVKSMDKMGKSIDDAQKEFQNLVTTRRNQLERSLRKIDDLRAHEGIALPQGEEILMPAEIES